MSKIKISKMSKTKITCLRKASLMFLFFEPSLVQKKVLEGLQGLGDVFNEN